MDQYAFMIFSSRLRAWRERRMQPLRAASLACLLGALAGGHALAQSMSTQTQMQAPAQTGFVMQPTAAPAETTRDAPSATPQRMNSRSADAAFRRADRDGDGRLSRRETEHFPALSQRFEQLDGDRDAFLSREEFNTVLGSN